MQGVGLEQLSMAQLDVLEGLHHAALAAIASRRLDLVSLLRNLSRIVPRFCEWPGGCQERAARRVAWLDVWVVGTLVGVPALIWFQP